jgi:hypothetical protein
MLLRAVRFTASSRASQPAAVYQATVAAAAMIAAFYHV